MDYAGKNDQNHIPDVFLAKPANQRKIVAKNFGYNL